MKAGEQYEIKEILTTIPKETGCINCYFQFNTLTGTTIPSDPCNLCTPDLMFKKHIELVRIK